jgi:adenosylcobyric acid synthase
MRGSLLVAGTTSDAGKSVLTTGICRWLHRQGVRVAPFKAQNMSNNSMVTTDAAEIGRAQWIQALAAGAEPEAAMNPVLLKPGSDRRSHVVLMGRPYGDLDASSFGTARTVLAEAAYAAYDDLAARYDVVVCEGAGSPTEINLREHDFVNMGLAQHGRIPTLVVGDIDRGGVFAAMYGTLKLMPSEDQELLRGFIVNKFRGDQGLLAPGLRMLAEATDRPVLGVVPWLPGLWLDSEDALDVEGRRVVGPGPGSRCCGSRSSGYRGSPTSPTSTPWLSSRTSTCPSSTGRTPSWRPTWLSCRGRGRLWTTWTGSAPVASKARW